MNTVSMSRGCVVVFCFSVLVCRCYCCFVWETQIQNVHGCIIVSSAFNFRGTTLKMFLSNDKREKVYWKGWVWKERFGSFCIQWFPLRVCKVVIPTLSLGIWCGPLWLETRWNSAERCISVLSIYCTMTLKQTGWDHQDYFLVSCLVSPPPHPHPHSHRPVL